MDINSIRESTHSDIIDKLNKFGKCAFIRPTGFGKTWELTRLAKMYDTVLYLYPAEVIKNTVVDRYAESDEGYDEETKLTAEEFAEMSGVTLMSYMKLIRLTADEIRKGNYSLIIMDEVHRVGGKATLDAARRLLDVLPNAKLVGATATPNRSDGFDVIDELFDSIAVYPYTLHDAFQDGLLKRPYYCFCTYNITDQVSKDLRKQALTAGEDLDDIRVKEVIDARMIEIANLFEMDKVIREQCNSCLLDTSYLKFIVFFNGLSHIEDKQLDVINWFASAYPDYKINEPLVISCDNSEHRNNVNRLDEMVRRPKTIDLVFCINMLNMGYHVNDISGVVMYRGTTSDIVYIQQLGRALSSGASESCLVFDVVDNLHRKAIFDVTDHSDLNGRDNRPGRESKYIDGVAPKPEGNIDVPGTSFLPPDAVPGSDEKWWRNSNKIYREDVYVTGNQATYKELIAKAVAEPMVQRCMQAFEAHFHRWCKSNDIPYPVPDYKLESLYNLSKEDFVAYFRNLIENEGIDYPMGDAKKLLQIGKKNEDGVPLEIFAKWKNVSIKSILDTLGVA